MSNWAYALSQGAANVAGAGADMADQQLKEEADQRAADRKLTDAERLLAIQQSMQDRAREAMTARIEAAKNNIADTALNTKYAGSNAAVADADAGNTDAPLTDDQRAAIGQAKAADKKGMLNSSDTLVQAAIQTGDIDPKTLATLTNKADIAQLKADNFKERTEMMGQLAEVRAKATTDAMQLRLDAAKEKAANGKIDAATGRMLITSEDANIKAATSQMNLITRQLEFAKKDERAGLLAQIDSLKDDIKTSKATKNAYMKDLGYPTSDDLPDAKSDAVLPTPSAPSDGASRPPLSSFRK